MFSVSYPASLRRSATGFMKPAITRPTSFQPPPWISTTYPRGAAPSYAPLGGDSCEYGCGAAAGAAVAHTAHATDATDAARRMRFTLREASRGGVARSRLAVRVVHQGDRLARKDRAADLQLEGVLAGRQRAAPDGA